MFLFSMKMFVIGACLAIPAIIYTININKKTKIQFMINPLDWIIPVIAIFFLITFAILAEYTVSLSLKDYFKQHNNDFLAMFFESGGLILLLCWRFSHCFGRLIKISGINLDPRYSEETAKRFFTIEIIANCLIWVFIFRYYKIHVDIQLERFYCRIMTWLSSALGIWLYIGLGCQRLGEKKIKSTKDKYIDRIIEILNLKFEYPIYLFVGLIVAIFLAGIVNPLVIHVIEGAFPAAIWFGIIYVVCTVTSFMILYPHVSKEKIFNLLANLSEQKRRFQRLRYSISLADSNTKFIVVVYERKIEGVLNCKLFKEKKDTFENVDKAHEKIYDFLARLDKNRQDKIAHSYRYYWIRQKDRLISDEHIYDKASWYINAGERPFPVIVKFIIIFHFLAEKKYLTTYGLETKEKHINKDVILSSSMINQEGIRFLDFCYDTVLVQNIEELMKYLEESHKKFVRK